MSKLNNFRKLKINIVVVRTRFTTAILVNIFYAFLKYSFAALQIGQR